MRAGRARAPITNALVAGAVFTAVVATLAGLSAKETAHGAVARATAMSSPTPVTPARGVDVSSFQHPRGAAINWRSVAGAGYRFAFIKSTEGSYYVNPYFKADAAAAEAAGMLVGAYHFANPADSSGTVQADYALNHGAYRPDGWTLRMILDIEPDPYLTKYCYGLSRSQMVGWIAAFMGEAHRRTGLWPVINTQPAWWDTCTGHTSAFAAYPLWVQDPGASPHLPSGWTSWAYWQYSITGRVAGVTGSTDLNKLTPAVLAVANPGDQSSQAGDRVRLQVRSVNMSTGQALSYAATGLPPGLSVNPTTGVISGTLGSSTSSVRVTVTVSAAGATPVTLGFAWHVHGKVTVHPPAAQTGLVGTGVSLQVRATDGLPGCTLRLNATGLPAGCQ